MPFFIYLFLIVLNFTPAQAITWEIITQKSKLPVHSGKWDAFLSKTCGETTVEILNSNQIEFTGSPQGINSILGTPTGSKAIAKLSETSMRVYGWCYEVDGVQPDVMPDKYFFKSQNSTLRWFFAYSLYENGEWKEFCTPAYLNPLKP